MGTFNFSNMKKEETYVPREFRAAVENAKQQPIGSGTEKTGFWDGIKNFFSGGDVDANNGFIDETGSWNNGTDQEMAKFTQPQYQTKEKAWNNSLAGQIVNSNAYKKYFYSKDDVLLEAKKISAATSIPENAILSSSDNLASAREVYNYQQRAMDPQKVFEAYPELSSLAQKSDTDAAIALHNLKNVRQTQGIIEAAKTGWELDNLMSERGRLGYQAMNGRTLTDDDLKRLAEITKQQKAAKELPSILEDPLGAIVGGTVQSGKMMVRNALNGQKMGVYGAGFGAVLGGVIGAGATLGAGTAPGAIAGAQMGYTWGSRIGMAQDMYNEVAGNNYLDYKNYKDKNGRQLLTDNQARLYAVAAAGVETAIEFSNADKILNIIKGGAGAQSLKNIISSATNSTELQSMLAQYVKDGMKNVGGVAISESAEEGAQEMSNRIISNVMAANNPGGDIPTYSVKDILAGGLEASWSALPASIGFGIGAHASSTVSFMRRAAAALQIKNEEQQANMQTANGISMLKNLAEDIKNNELFKKSPEVYREVLNNQLQGTDLETVNIDTEYVLHQEGGYELLKETADKIGISEEQFKDIVETKADLKINTADYVEKCLPNDIGGRLEDYITFSDIGECLARNREYAARMKREMDRVLAFEERQREDALNTFLDKNFPNPENREVAEAVLRRFPDNPKEGVKEIRKSLQAKIDEPLNEIIAELEAGMGNGVAIVETEEFDGQLRGRGVRVSNNAPWYQKYYKENKKTPNKRELRDIAYDIYTGKNEYGLLGWENNSTEEDQWYQNNKASIEATEEAIRRLDALTPMLEKIDPGELSITEGLSEEGFEVYRKLRGQLEGAESKQVRQAAQMSAIIAARMADRMAELHRKAGQRKYTALDYARSIGLVRDGEVGGGLKQRGVDGLRYKTSNINAEATKYKNSKAIAVDKEIVKKTANESAISQALRKFEEAYPTEQKIETILGSVVINKKSVKNSLAHGFSQKKLDATTSLVEGMQQASYIGSIKDLDNKNIDNHFFAYKINYSEQENIVFCRIKENNGQPMKLYIHEVVDMETLKKRSSSLNETASLENGSVSRQASKKMSTPRGLALYNSILNQFLEDVKKTDQFAQKSTTIIEPSNGVPYVSNKSYRCTNGDAISSYTGYAMFADYAPAVDMYGDNLYTVNHADLTDIDEIKPKIEAAWDEAAERGTIPNELESLADERSGKEIAEDFDPQDIVDGAGAWDVPELVSWAFDAGVFDDISGVKTKDGAVTWDESLISQGDKDAEVWGMDEESYDQRAWHGTPYNFERFDIGKIGAGVGDQVHGWGLYFAKNKKVSDNYKKVLSEGGNTEASLFKVEVPDNKYLLDEQKPFYEQLKDVQKHTAEAIESLNDEQQKRFWSRILKFKLDAINKSHSVETRINHLDTIANHSLESLTKADVPRFRKNISRRNLSNHGYTEEQIARLETDEEYRQQEKGKMLAEIQELNVELEKAAAEDNAAKAKIIGQAQNNTAEELGNYSNRYRFTGEKVYDALAYALGGKEPDWRGASETLNAHDVKGITYDGMRDGRCFVVFDDKAVDIIERYNQAAGEYAMNANMTALQEAKEMTAQGKGKEEIYQKTGWHLGADGKWRFEIPDNLDDINLGRVRDNKQSTLGEIYNNPALYQAYPWLRNIPVTSEELQENQYGYARGEKKIALNANYIGRSPYELQNEMLSNLKEEHGVKEVVEAFKGIVEEEKLPNKQQIKTIAENLPDQFFNDREVIDVFSDEGLNQLLDPKQKTYSLEEKEKLVQDQFKEALENMKPNDKIKETLIHEIQHIIQSFEGFAVGGSPKNVNKQMDLQLAKYDEEIKRLHPKGKEYQQALLEYDVADWNHATEEISDEEFQKYKDKLTELEAQIPKDKAERIKEINKLQTDLQWQADNEEAEAYNNYHDLHGEQEARAAAMKARLYTMGASQQRIDNEVLNGVDDASAIIVFGGKSYSMNTEQQGLWQLKGQTAFKATGEKLISLFKAADQSTFLHEMAHVYYHDMLELAKLPNAPKQLLDDVATIEEWAKWDEQQFDKEYKGTALEREFKKLNKQMKEASEKGFVEIDGRKMSLEQMQKLWTQERFARGFENYLKEGKAPTESVRSVFRRFKQWLTQIYRAFSQIGGAPSKEVKAVMDRMVASEDEIDIAMKKKGVDDFAKDGGMDYLADSSKQVYNRMVERAKADAEEKALKIALKDVKEEHAKQESEFFAQEEADYREKLAAEPVFIIQEHLKNNPSLSTSAVCETLGMSVEDYAAKLKEYGGSLDTAVKSHMKEVKKSVDNSGLNAQFFREKAEEVVQESRYRKLAAAMELNAFEAIAKKQRSITVKVKKEEQNTDDEKGLIKTVDKITKQSKKIEELTGENKQLKSDKRNLLTNVRGLRDAAVKHYQEYVQYVEMKLEVMPLKDANNYQMWRRKSAQAQYSSEQSLIKGEWDKAVRYKQAQLIYEMFADRAVRNAKQVKKIEDGLKRKQQTITKNKNISADERYAFNHLMYVFGFSDNDAPQPPKYEGIMEVLMKADATREEGGLMLESPFFTPDGQTNLPEWFFKASMDVQKRKEGHSDLSNMQLDLLAQVMHIIYKRGMDNMNLHTIKTRDGKTITVDEAIAEIEGQARQRMAERINADPTGANDSTKFEQAENFVDAADKALIKPEVELKKMGDVAVRYIYDPLKEAADKELKMSVDMQSRLKNLFGEYTEQELRDMRTKQLYKFGSSTLTKEQAIMLALNWGTEINQKRVMDGYRVNVAQVKSVLANLTEKDWRLVDAVWKLYDRHWDDVKEIEARMSGAVLQKQEAKGFVIIGTDKKIYTIDGGYFPIKYDPRDIRTQEQKADAAVQQSAMSNIAMSLGKGFLKDRSNAKIERRLDLHFEVISDSLTDVIHLVAFREPVRDVRRIVLNDNFKNLVYRYLGQNTYKNLKKWTADCWAEESIPKTAYEKAMAKMRNAQTMGTMGFRTTTALLNLANLPSVAHYMGAAEMLHALKKFYSAPREYADFIFQRSVFMAERSETMDASIRDAIKGPSFLDNVPGIGKAGDAIKDNAFKMITWTDLMLALPLWQHEYEKAYNAEFEAGRSAEMSRQAGVAAGDAAVRWCFGSGRTVDKAAIQRGGELVKQLTMYYSYNSTVYNALNYKIWEAKVGYKKAVAAAAKNKNLALMKAVAHAGDALLMWILLPAVISALLRAGASGDDDDWKIDKLLKATGKESLTGLVGGIPILRDAIPFLVAKVFDEKQYAPKIPVQNTIDQTNRVIQSIVNDKKTIADTLREMGKLTSQLTGAPSTLIDGFATTLQYIESGFEEDIATYLRALIFDKNLKKK